MGAAVVVSGAAVVVGTVVVVGGSVVVVMTAVVGGWVTTVVSVEQRFCTRLLRVCLFCLLVAYRPSNRLVYLRDGSAQTILRAATLR